MLIKKRNKTDVPSSEITPHHTYLSRRNFMKTAAVAGGAGLLAACSPRESVLGVLQQSVNQANGDPPTPQATAEVASAGDDLNGDKVMVMRTDELGDPLTRYQDVTNYNNYYEFTTDKSTVAFMVDDFPTSPWQVEVGGLVRNPGIFDIDDIRRDFEQEERIYRLRCVEGWSMVIPWQGFALRHLLDKVEPTSDAKFVRFQSILDPDNMPGQRSRWLNWPYVEGLRLDEAMNDLALLVTGLYGEDLPTQNGSPLRLAVPWKYGFKSTKAIVKIDLVDYMPTSAWMDAAPNEYGFFANVNPTVDHPRWSQKTERRIGEVDRRETLMYNGYGEQVGHLYAGMDLDENF